MTDNQITVGTDIGGTFTDVWVTASDGRTAIFKSPTTSDLISGIIDALELAADEYDMEFTEFCERIERFGHGTTVGLNALLTGDAGETALLTTNGFADTLEIGRLKRQYAGLNTAEVRDYTERGQWPPLVSRENVREVSGRVDRSGAVVQPLQESEIQSIASALAEEGVDAIAVCLLWATENPAHERRICGILEEELPETYLSASHDVAPVVGEYGRMSTTLANAMLGPVMSSYFGELAASLRNHGFSERILAMTQAGGVVPAEGLASLPVSALFSGPAAMVIGCQAVGTQVGEKQLLTVDAGGTSFDTGLIVDGTPEMRSETTIGGADIQFPSIDVSSIGAGGGSIASVSNDSLSVGPESATSDPGPACYGRGGQRPTATDADLVLGVLNPDYFLGGQMDLDADAAKSAIRTAVAEPLEMSVREAAWGIRRVLDSKMSDLLRRVTIERGYDPREFTMVACGGAGPSHAWILCDELGIGTFIVPPTATVHSAYGTGNCDMRRTEEVSVHVRLESDARPTEDDLESLRTAFDEVRTGVSERFEHDVSNDAIELATSISVQYSGQHNSVDVAYPSDSVTRESFAEFLEAFEDEYESLYGRGAGFRDAGFELQSVRAVATVPLESLETTGEGEPLHVRETRPVVFDDPESPVETDVYRTRRPAAGESLDGPAVIEYVGHTAVVPPGGRAKTDEYSNLHVEVS